MEVFAIGIFLVAILEVYLYYRYYRLTRYDGTVHLEEGSDGVKTYFLDLNYDPEELIGKRKIIFKVVSNDIDS